jgi:nitrogen-specific signal transduction histidine kinase
LPKVLGDSNQLLQVCLQLVANCLHVLSERGGRVLTLSTERQADTSVLQIVTEPIPRLSAAGPQPFSTVEGEDALGLSACQGILQEHRGKISWEHREDGAMLLRIELPMIESAPVKTNESTVSVLWQSRPYA